MESQAGVMGTIWVDTRTKMIKKVGQSIVLIKGRLGIVRPVYRLKLAMKVRVARGVAWSLVGHQEPKT